MIRMRIAVTFLMFFFNSTILHLYAQDKLVLRDGRKIAYGKMELHKDSIEVTTYDEKEHLIFHHESIVGYCSPIDEENYYIKRNIDFNSDDSYQFFERMEVGRINLYRRQNTSEEYYLYMEKDGHIDNVYSFLNNGKRKKGTFETFLSFVDDDEISLRYVNDKKFNYRYEDIIIVVQYYNRRNFVPNDPSIEKTRGTVFFYRTKFQKLKKELKIELFGKTHDLYVDDFIQFDMPIESASEITVTSDYSSNNKLLAAEMTDQYYEVIFDKKARRFVFEKKTGTERQYEFYKIKKKVGGK